MDESFLLLLLLLLALATGKILSQRVGAGRHVHSPIDSILFITVFFFFTSFTFLPSFLAAPPAGVTVAFAIGAALLNLGFQVSYTVAMTTGPVGLTVLISSLALLIPVLGASLFFGEEFGILRAIGLALTLLAFVLNTDFKRREGGNSHIWGIAVTLTFLFNGFATLWQKWFALGPYGTDIAGYNFLAYSLAAVIGLLLLLVLSRYGKKPTGRPGWGFFGWAALIGVFLSCFQWLFTYSQRVLDAALLLPIYNGASTVVITVIGVIFYREKMTKRRLASTIVGVAAIVLFGITR